MGIALVIVGGLTLMTLFTVTFDYLGKKKGKNDSALEQKLAALENRVEELENDISQKGQKIEALEGTVSFMNRLIEGKTE